MEATQLKIGLLKILLFNESRKAGFGLWLFVVSTTMVFMGGLIDSEKWMLCVALTTTLIGGGTLADKWMNIKEKKETGNVTDTKNPE